METLLEDSINTSRLNARDPITNTSSVSAQVLTFPRTHARTSTTEDLPAFSEEERIHWLEAYGGHCMSYSTLQPNMQYFDLPGVGFIAYRDALGERVVLSDPICPPHLQVLLISEFLKASPKRTSFVQVTSSVAQILAQQFNMYTTEFGQETVIPLASWSLKGKKKQIFRTALNQADKLGIKIMETFSHLHDDYVSDSWLSTRRCKNNEIGFLIRPKDMPYQKDVRRFYGYKDLQPIGFVHFDPIYQQGNVIGYVPNISRANHLFKQGLFYAIMAVALEQFQKEGIKLINLGLSPLHLKGPNTDEVPGIRSSRLLTRMFLLTQRFGQRFYNFQGIQFTKQRFRGEEHTTYVASRKALPLKAFLACFKLSNLI